MQYRKIKVMQMCLHVIISAMRDELTQIWANLFYMASGP